jgi:hypothetical protein
MIKLLKECHQTCEDWYLYEVSQTGSWDWVNGFEIRCYTDSDGKILLDMPHAEGVY